MVVGCGSAEGVGAGAVNCSPLRLAAAALRLRSRRGLSALGAASEQRSVQHH